MQKLLILFWRFEFHPQYHPNNLPKRSIYLSFWHDFVFQVLSLYRSLAGRQFLIQQKHPKLQLIKKDKNPFKTDSVFIKFFETTKAYIFSLLEPIVNVKLTTKY